MGREESSTLSDSDHKSQPQDPRRSKYSSSTGKRRFAPKTRSGCKTCRKRRVKCTEEKPCCLRCLKGDFTCVYAPDPNEWWHSSIAQQSIQLRYGSDEETFYFKRFNDFCVPWFSQFAEKSFFYDLIPRRSWFHPALKHAIVAVTMASESSRAAFIPSPFTYNADRHQRRHDWHYAQALQHMYKANNVNEDEVLLTSVMFWIHDNVTKNSRTAMVHLQGFLRILSERKIRNQRSAWKENEWEGSILRGLVFSADVADRAFAEILAPDMMQSIRSRLRDPNYSRRFQNISSVRDELRICLAAIPYSTLENTSSTCDTNSPVSVTELRTYLERWFATFSRFPETREIDRIVMECHYICLALALSVHESGQRKPDDPQSISRMDYVLSLLESIDLQDLPHPPLGKDLEMPLIPVLSQLIVLAPNNNIRLRASVLLRSINRIEGLWSSDVVADMISITFPPFAHGHLLAASMRHSNKTGYNHVDHSDRAGSASIEQQAIRSSDVPFGNALQGLPRISTSFQKTRQKDYQYFKDAEHSTFDRDVRTSWEAMHDCNVINTTAHTYILGIMKTSSSHPKHSCES